MSNQPPATPTVTYDQRGQTVHGNLTNIAGDVNMGGGLFNAGNINVAGDINYYDFLGRIKLPTDYTSWVRNFQTYYLGTGVAPAPFGGRDKDIARLDRWLSTPDASRYLLLAEPAGRGKSALLTHWITRLKQRDDFHIVFFPISIRFNTNRESVVFSALAAMLARVYGEDLALAIDAQQYRSMVSAYLRRVPPNSKNLLIVLDGLDEAAGWEAKADLFPLPPPSHLKVVVAARGKSVKNRNADPWLTQLGWEHGQGEYFNLEGLDEAGVADVLEKMGNPLNVLSTNMNLVSKLYELSEGDPLLVGLYVQALLPYGSQSATFLPKDLLTLKSGLNPFFDRWFDEQKKLWRDSGLRPDIQTDTAINGFLNLCAFAKGPLSKDDMFALAPNELHNGATISWAAEMLSRFVLGNGSPENGYVFSHPRFGDYFGKERLPAQECKQWRKRFLDYGRQTLNDLHGNQLTAEDASPYIVRYYGAHLVDAEAPPEEFYALVCEGWLRAWEHIDGTPDGFMGDVNRTCEAAISEGAPALGKVAKAVLCASSLASLSGNLSTELLIAAIAIGKISPQLALAIARTKADPKERVECLAAISKYVSQEMCVYVIHETLLLLSSINDPDEYDEAFTTVVKHLPANPQLIVKVLEIIANIWDKNKRYEALERIIGLLPLDRIELWRQLLTLIPAFENEFNNLILFIKLMQRLPTQYEDLINSAVDIARNITHDEYRIIILLAVLNLLPRQEQEETLNRGIVLAFNAREGKNLKESRANSKRVLWSMALTNAVKHLSADQQTKVLDIALDVLRSHTDYEVVDAQHLYNLTLLLPKELQPPLIDEIIKQVQSGEESWDLRMSTMVAKHLPPDAQLVMLQGILRKLRTVKDIRGYGYILPPLVEQLALDAPSLLTEFAEILRAEKQLYAIDEFDTLLKSADAYVPQSAEDVWSVLREIVRSDPDNERQIALVSIIARFLPKEDFDLVTTPLINARRIGDDEQDYGDILSRMIEIFPPDQAAYMFATLTMIFRSNVDISRAGHLEDFAYRLLPEQIEIARNIFAEAITLDTEHEQVSVIQAIVRTISPEAKDLLGNILKFAFALQDEGERAKILVDLIDRLPAEASVLVDKVREIAYTRSAINNPSVRAYILCDLAKYIPANEQHKALQEALFSAREAKESSESYIRLLGYIAAKMTSEFRTDVINEALADTKLLSPLAQKWALFYLVRQLPLSDRSKVIDQALTLAKISEKPESGAQALFWFLPFLPADEQRVMLQYAIEMTHSIKGDSNRVSTLCHGAIHLSDEHKSAVLQEALDVARNALFIEVSCKLICQVAEQLPPSDRLPVIQEVLLELPNIDPGEKRMQVLTSLAKCLTPELTELHQLLLREVYQLRHEEQAVDILVELVPYWQEICVANRRTEFEEVVNLLSAFADTRRRQLLRTIVELMPVIARLGGERAVLESTQAIVEVRQWWS